MRSVISSMIRIGMQAIYSAFYVILEGLLKISRSWPPIISITGVISVLLTYPLLNLFRWGYLCWDREDIPVNLMIFIGVGICCIVYWLLYQYYFPFHNEIEQKTKSKNLKVKILLCLLALVIITGSISLGSHIFEIYLKCWKNYNH